uniref:Uncharacterized protein n=1 Tax=Anguilla anguilla TaxID=7936 RepID=A0A0E9UP64_ANGAN
MPKNMPCFSCVKTHWEF